MKKITFPKEIAYIILAFFFTITAHSQLPDFTVNAVPTPAACGGTGSVLLSAIGANPAATVTYSVYLLPNTATPIAVTTSTTVGTLGPGNYQVLATQTLGAASNTSPPVNFTIVSLVVPTVFVAVQTQAICGNDGKITVNVTTGNGPYTYELYAGTTTTNPIVAAQTSNTFNNLAPGGYTVRVIDSCGAVNNQYVVVAQTPFAITIGPISIEAGELPSCNSILVNNGYSIPSGGTVSYPLTFVYTIINPNGGAPTIITRIVASAPPGAPTLQQEIPFYHNQQYSYSLQVTDACGRVFTRNNIVNARFAVSQTKNHVNCSDNILRYTVSRYVGPYTVNFTTAPAGFNPWLANPQHPTFTEPTIAYGEDSSTVPDGTYVAVFTDACGRTFTTPPLVVEYPEVDVATTGGALCGATTGSMRAFFNIEGRTVTQVIITDAPQAYKNSILPQVLPKDVSQFISAQPTTGFLMENIPLGAYVLLITDSCGVTYTKTINIAPSGGELVVSHTNRPGCELGTGSLRIGDPTQGPFLSSVIITQTDANLGPVTFPFDVSANISTNGAFYMSNLPQGNYTFQITGGDCNSTTLKEIVVTGYQITTNTVDIVQFCGSFDININNITNGNFAQSFYLQKYNEVSGTWGHPFTNVAYPEGTQPTNQNSVLIPDNNQLYPYSGQFRILKVFFTFSTGNSFNNRCTEILHTFTIGAGPVITEFLAVPCANGSVEVAIIATGVAPLTYKIVSKDEDDTFIVDNGTSNIFSGLAIGVYKVEVTDNCANMTNYQFDVNEVDPIEIIAEGFCEDEISSLYVQDYPFLTYEWFRADAPTVILSTDNTLEYPAFDSDTESGVYKLRITAASECLNQTLEFTVAANIPPNAGLDNPPAIVCNDGSTIDLSVYLSAGHDTGGTWKDANGNALTNSMFSIAGVASGTYQFTYTVTGLCDNDTDEAIITIILTDIPQAPVVNAVPDVCEGSAVQLGITSTLTGGTYQWTGPDGFTSSEQNPVLQNATMGNSGTYTVFVTNTSGCASPPATVNVTIKPTPAITIEGDLLLCEGQSGYLSIEGTNLIDNVTVYQWYFNNTLLQGVTTRDIQIFEAGTYKAIATNDNCVSVPATIQVTKNENAFAVEMESGCENDRYIVRVTNLTDLPDAVFAWTGPEGYTGSGAEIDITGGAKGDYKVTVTNIQGCTVNAVITINSTSCMIPKGISPNNDGDNDTFDLSELNVQHLHIYNRYGLHVYEKSNYKKEWYGQSDKGDLPTGTYYYVITLPNKTVTGWVYIQREM